MVDLEEMRQMRSILQGLWAEREPQGMSLSEFGVELARVAGRDRPYTRQYMNNMLRGPLVGKNQLPFPIPREAMDGIRILARRHGDEEDVRATAMQVTVPVMSYHDLRPYIIIMGKPRQCALDTCEIWFVPDWPSRRYCGPAHAKEARRLARHKAQKTD